MPSSEIRGKKVLQTLHSGYLKASYRERRKVRKGMGSKTKIPFAQPLEEVLNLEPKEHKSGGVCTVPRTISFQEQLGNLMCFIF